MAIEEILFSACSDCNAGTPLENRNSPFVLLADPRPMDEVHASSCAARLTHTFGCRFEIMSVHHWKRFAGANQDDWVIVVPGGCVESIAQQASPKLSFDSYNSLSGFTHVSAVYGPFTDAIEEGLALLDERPGGHVCLSYEGDRTAVWGVTQATHTPYDFQPEPFDVADSVLNLAEGSTVLLSEDVSVARQWQYIALRERGRGTSDASCPFAPDWHVVFLYSVSFQRAAEVAKCIAAAGVTGVGVRIHGDAFFVFAEAKAACIRILALLLCSGLSRKGGLDLFQMAQNVSTLEHQLGGLRPQSEDQD